MKKILVTFLLFVSIFACIFGITACGGLGNADNPNTNNPNIENPKDDNPKDNNPNEDDTPKVTRTLTNEQIFEVYHTITNKIFDDSVKTGEATNGGATDNNNANNNANDNAKPKNVKSTAADEISSQPKYKFSIPLLDEMSGVLRKFTPADFDDIPNYYEDVEDDFKCSDFSTVEELEAYLKTRISALEEELKNPTTEWYVGKYEQLMRKIGRLRSILERVSHDTNLYSGNDMFKKMVEGTEYLRYACRVPEYASAQKDCQSGVWYKSTYVKGRYQQSDPFEGIKLKYWYDDEYIYSCYIIDSSNVTADSPNVLIYTVIKYDNETKDFYCKVNVLYAQVLGSRILPANSKEIYEFACENGKYRGCFAPNITYPVEYYGDYKYDSMTIFDGDKIWDGTIKNTDVKNGLYAKDKYKKSLDKWMQSTEVVGLESLKIAKDFDKATDSDIAMGFYCARNYLEGDTAKQFSKEATKYAGLYRAVMATENAPLKAYFESKNQEELTSLIAKLEEVEGYVNRPRSEWVYMTNNIWYLDLSVFYDLKVRGIHGGLDYRDGALLWYEQEETLLDFMFLFDGGENRTVIASENYVFAYKDKELKERYTAEELINLDLEKDVVYLMKGAEVEWLNKRTPTGITFDSHNSSLSVGEAVHITARVENEDGALWDSYGIKWEVDKEGIVEIVDKYEQVGIDGIIEIVELSNNIRRIVGLAPGVVTIKATVKGYETISVECRIEVLPDGVVTSFDGLLYGWISYTVEGYLPDGTLDYTYEVEDGKMKFLRGNNENDAVYEEYERIPIDDKGSSFKVINYVYRFLDGTWVRREKSSSAEFETKLFVLYELVIDDFEFDTENEVYRSKHKIISKWHQGKEFNDVVLKFRNKQLVELQVDITAINNSGDRESTGLLTFKFGKYGETSVTLPENFTEYDEVKDPALNPLVSLENWSSEIESFTRFSQYSLTVDGTLIMNTIFYNENENRTYIYSIEDGQYYAYESFGSDWKRYSITQEQYNNAGRGLTSFIQSLVNDYSAFTYIGNGVSKAENLDKTAELGLVLTVVEVRKFNGVIQDIKYKFSVEYDGEYGTLENTIRKSDVQIELPENFTEYDEVKDPALNPLVSLENWGNEIQSFTRFSSNFSTVDGTLIMQTIPNNEKCIYSIEGGQYYAYESFGSDWKRYSITQEQYNNAGRGLTSFIQSLVNDYSAFTYIGNGVSKAENLDKTAELGLVLTEVEVRKFNGVIEFIRYKFSTEYGTGESEMRKSNVQIELPAEFTDSNDIFMP